MQILLDTHAFLWWTSDDPALGDEARVAITEPDNVVFVSAATTWEIAIKRALGRLDAPGDIASWVPANGFVELAIDIGHSIRSAALPFHHRDPFDRLLIAQAQVEELKLATSDPEIVKYDVSILDAGL